MKHLTEEQIVLHYYGDAEGEDEVRLHLSECLECRGAFDRVRELLQQIEPTEVPEPPAVFEQKTWLNLRDRLSKEKGGFRSWFSSTQWPSRVRRSLVAAACAALLVAAFLLGRYGPGRTGSNAANPQRVVLVAVGGHLERSQILLVELMNTEPRAAVDLSHEQRQARDLLDANHLYRVSAQQAGNPAIAGLLDDLGRVLTEVANGPSDMSASDLQEIQGRIQSQGLLFKIRVVGSQVDSKVRSLEQLEQRDAGNTNRRL